MLQVGGEPEQARALIHAMLPVPRYGRPEEVAALVAFLLSEESRYQIGGVFPIDAGVTVGQFIPPPSETTAATADGT